MINYWKQFGAWVIGLKDDPFIRARAKLTFLYAVSTIIVFVVGYFILAYLNGQMLNAYLLNSQALAAQSLSQVLDQTTFKILFIIALTVIVINFFVAAKTLVPIRQIIRTQKRFIAYASHELRTPLAIMKTNSEVALLDGLAIKPREAVEVLKSNIEEIERMSKIIENLLSLSYYDNRVTEIPLIPVNVAEVVKNITAKAQSLAVKMAVRLKLEKADPGVILGNPTALEEMTINLIKNAVTYTPRGGAVAVSVESKNKAFLELKVTDTGVGISQKDLPHIFSPFYKAGDGRVKEQGSSGLGLTIVKKIVDRHRGEIEVASEVGKGTSVTVTLPSIPTVRLRKALTS